MRRWLALLLFVCLLAAGLLCLLPSLFRLRVGARGDDASVSVSRTESQSTESAESKSEPNLNPSVEPAAGSSPVAAKAGDEVGTNQDLSSGGAVGSDPDIPPTTVLENVHVIIRQYGSMFGGNPVGTNPEITSALNGGNLKHVKFLRPDAGMRVNAKGELVDAWGTPYFFHQLSGTEMEIRSAGPDRIMWTADDLVLR